MNEYLRIGVLINTHGIKGEMKVYPTTDDNNRFKELESVLIDTGKDVLELKVEGVRFHKNLVLMKFKHYDNINDIEKYKGMDLLVTRENAVKLEENEYFIYDIIGAEVTTEEGEFLGCVKEVIMTGANDVYVVQDDGKKELLLPVIPECVRKIDIDNKKILVHLMQGLRD